MATAVSKPCCNFSSEEAGRQTREGVTAVSHRAWKCAAPKRTAPQLPVLGVTLVLTLVFHIGLTEFQVCYFGYIEKLNRRHSRGDRKKTVER